MSGSQVQCSASSTLLSVWIDAVLGNHSVVRGGSAGVLLQGVTPFSSAVPLAFIDS
jgi:hypothetical protein